MVYGLKEHTKKAATSVNSREGGTMLSSLMFILWQGARYLPSIGTSKPLAIVYSGGQNMWSDSRCLLRDSQIRLPPTTVSRTLSKYIHFS